MPRAFSAAMAATASGRNCWRTAKTWHCEPRRNATTDTFGIAAQDVIGKPVGIAEGRAAEPDFDAVHQGTHALAGLLDRARQRRSGA